MSRIRRLSFAALAFALAGSLFGALPNKAKAHGLPLSGRVASVDDSKKTFVVVSAGGKATSLVWTDATKITGGTLKAGEPITLRYLDKNGIHIATSVRIGPPPSPKPPAAATTPVVTPTAPQKI